MITVSSNVFRVVQGSLSLVFLFVLTLTPDMAYTSDSRSYLIDYRYLVQYGEPDLMANLHFGNTPLERKPPPNPTSPVLRTVHVWLQWGQPPLFPPRLLMPGPRYVVAPPPPFPSKVKGKGSGLIDAASRGDADRVKSLLNSGTDVNAKDERGWTPLMEAANRRQLEVAKLLLDKGADVNLKHQYGWTALSIAKGKDNKEIVKLLKAHGAKK